MLKLTAVFVVLFMAIGSADVRASILVPRSESFNVDPGWDGVGNAANGNNFGFRNSANAGGSLGEAGGTIARTLNRAYYGDTILGGLITLDHQIRASGRLSVSNLAFNNAVRIGHFSTLGSDNVAFDFLGFQVAEPEPSTDSDYRIMATIFLGDTVPGGVRSAPLRLSPDEDYKWLYEWNPDLNAGNGLLTVEFFESDDTSIGNVSVGLSSSQRTTGVSLDAFGLSTGAIGGPISPSNAVDVFIDDVSYSTAQVVPEPASVGIWSLIGIVAIGLGWSSKRRSALATS